MLEPETAYERAIAQAYKEVEEEYFREQVDRIKAEIVKDNNRSFWHKLFPWKIEIKRI